MYAPCVRRDIGLRARASNASRGADRLGCCQMVLGDTSATSTRHECDVMTDGMSHTENTLHNDVWVVYIPYNTHLYIYREVYGVLDSPYSHIRHIRDPFRFDKSITN